MSPQAVSHATAAQLRTRWQALAPRERRLVRAASAAIALALLWWVGIAPALQTQRTAPARHAELDAELQRMQALQAEAQQLQGTPRADPDNARRALESAVTEHLGGSARLSLSGDQATVTLKGTPADALAPWLAQVRSNAHAVPQEVHLVRSGAAAAEGRRTTALSDLPAAAPAPLWDGTLVLALPPR
ncbi:general secretion pathway protein GspM [Acidovorax sp. SRB_14]|uniref:type II secretion system protein GspM n=1 Tax=unclassified Acidovorax TaxID=2684926 RepID=UPI00145CC628|nr:MULTISPECIES: type II secretion system protein GspM [unclassified Acidovorax]NMM78204.1 general secretion pathway protein GspM [Acidovorax sp. SRB_24]NMM80166.1 general secretion pathway protein GspM [Acidovorax sp. SRB_14]NMM91422.1 general secretion pathway protein GspM [Rhodococcus sp. SRB_17]